MIRIYLLGLFTLATLLYSKPYPSIFLEMGTPLYSANSIFSNYLDFKNIKNHSNQYQKFMHEVLKYGYRLDKMENPPKKDILNYLKKLRELQSKYDYITYMLSSLLLQSIDKDDYNKFRRIATIEIDSLEIFDLNSEKIISYYKKNLHKGKIENIERLNSKNQRIKKHIVTNSIASKHIYDIYWASSIGGSSQKYDGGIYGANIDAMDIPTKIINLTSRINPVTVDKDGNIYWCDVTNMGIYKANPDGTNIRKIISGIKHPIGIAIDNNNKRVYWANWLNEKGKRKGEIGFSSLSGSGKHIIISDRHVLKSGGHIFYDGVYNKLYVSDLFGHQVIRIDLKTNNTTKISNANQPADLVVDYKNRRVIWSDIAKDSISSVKFDGSDKKVLIKFKSIFANPGSLTIDTINNRLVYAINTKKGGEQLETSNLDGTNRQVVNNNLASEVLSLFSVF